MPSNLDSKLPVAVKISVSSLKALEKQDATVIVKGPGVAFELKSGFATLTGNDVSVEMEPKDVKSLNKDLNYSPVSLAFELDVLMNNKKIDKFNVKPVITVTLPKGTKSPEKQSAYVQNKDGSWQFIMTYYDPKTNTVSFSAPHFSSYALSSYTKTFDDIKGHWAKAYIEEMASKQITSGVTDTEFEPNRSITRAEFTMMALKAIDQFEAGNGTFNDVKSDAWYADYLAKAKDLGLISANAIGNFYPEENISREDMAVIVAKAHAILKDVTLESSTKKASFKDASDIDSSKMKYVSYVQEKGIITGYNNAFMPNDEASRAEALSIIRQMINTK